MTKCERMARGDGAELVAPSQIDLPLTRPVDTAWASALVDALTAGGLDNGIVKGGGLKNFHHGTARLVFGMDATGSRAASWEQAIVAQAAMFEAVDEIGGLEVQLVHFGGDHCQASPFMSSGAELARIMRTVRCVSGCTQIGQVLGHVSTACSKGPVKALVYIGDCMEEGEAALLEACFGLSARGVCGFFFQEGGDYAATSAYGKFAKAMNGAHCTLSANSAAELKALLAAVAVYIVGGRSALQKAIHLNGAAQLLRLR